QIVEHEVNESMFTGFLGSTRARLYCSAARRTALWKTRRSADLLLKNRASHACEFSAGGRKQHASGVRSPDSHRLREFFPEPQSTQTKKQIRHHNKHYKIRPVFEEICAAQNNPAHKRNEIRRGE